MRNADLPAMPHTTWDNEVNIVIDQGEGLTKREHYAGLAMQGLCTHSGDYHLPQHLASDAVMYADALLAELGRVK